MDIEQLKAWVRREELRRDLVTAAPLAAMAATLNHSVISFAFGDATSCCPQDCRSSPPTAICARGLQPSIPLARRMWAGSPIEFLRPLRVGEEIQHRSTIEDVTLKDGRTGLLAFVKIRHEISSPAGICILELQDTATARELRG